MITDWHIYGIRGTPPPYATLYPLMGAIARGKFLDWWIFKYYKGAFRNQYSNYPANPNRYKQGGNPGMVVERIHYPEQPRTAKQQGNRIIFSDALYHWHYFTNQTKTYYNEIANPIGEYGIHRYTKLYINANYPMIIYWDTLEKNAADTSRVPDYIASPYFTRGLNIQPITWDGWLQAKDTYSYATATTITVSAGAVAKYKKGDKLKFNQHGSTKYFYVIGVADTLLTVVGNGTIVVEDTASYPISDNYLSHIENPIGFPGYFTWVPTWSTDGGDFTNNPTVVYAKYRIKGSYLFLQLYAICNSTSGGSGRIKVTVPVMPINNNTVGYGIPRTGVEGVLHVFVYFTGIMYIKNYDGSSICVNSLQFTVNCEYEF